MSWSPEKTEVKSWNEWDTLRHVIVGRADDCHIPPEEPALDAKVPEDSDMRGQWGRRPQETIDRANELLDNFASQLEKRGLRVDRPTSIDHSLPVTTPDFHTDSQFGCMPPRDVLLTVGNEMLEECKTCGSMQQRKVQLEPDMTTQEPTPLWGLSDEGLASRLSNAERGAKKYQDLAAECRFHQMLRKHVKREHLKEQGRMIEAQLAELSEVKS